MSVNLPVYQQVALLAIHDDKGTFQAEFIEHLLAGAIFAELMLQGCVTVTGKDKRVSVKHITARLMTTNDVTVAERVTIFAGA